MATHVLRRNKAKAARCAAKMAEERKDMEGRSRWPPPKVSGFFADDVGDAAKSIPRDGRARA